MKINQARTKPPKNMIGPRVMYLSKLIRREHNKAWAEHGLFSGQQDILFALIIREGMTLKEIARQLEISPATASVSVKRMEKTGFIIKKADECDARIVRLYPTQKAKDTAGKVKSFIDITEREMHRELSAEQAQLLCDALDTVIENLLKGCDENCC